VNPRKLSDCLAELAEVRALVRDAKRHVMREVTRASLYIADARLGHAIACLQATDAAWEEVDSPLATLNSPLFDEGD